MSTLSAIQPKIGMDRYKALLRMAKAMAVCDDCDAAENVLTQELRNLASFDYLHLVSFESSTKCVSWELLHVDGKTLDVSDRGGFLRESPADWVPESQQPPVSGPRGPATCFPTYREILKRLGAVSTCSRA